MEKIKIENNNYYYNVKDLELLDRKYLKFFTLYNTIKDQNIENVNMQGCGTVLYKVGDIMMQIMMKYTNDIIKNNKVNKITIQDNSKWKCDNFNFELIYLRTLTQGEPFYSKYGFTPVNSNDYEKYRNNKIIFKKNIRLNKLELKDIKFKDENLKKIFMDSIKNNKNKTVAEYIKDLLENKNNCKMFHNIYKEIYRKCGYDEYDTKAFKIIIKKN